MRDILIKKVSLLKPVENTRDTLILSFLLVLIWSIFSEILKYNQIIFYDAFNLRVFFSNIVFSLVVIIYFRSIILSIIGLYSFLILPFVTYYFLRKGILFRDFENIDELIYAFGNFNSFLIYFISGVFIILVIITNIRFFKIRALLFQIIFLILILASYFYPKTFEKFFYPSKPNIEDFNISAAFRFIGPVDALIYNYLNTLSFENNLMKNKNLMKYNDFRAFDLGKVNKNIHIIVLESFIDPTDFKNIKLDKTIIPNQWIDYKNENLFYGISPVIGGGSAQAEFEILCGAPSILEYGTEFNRIGDYSTNCLPNYLKKYGYKTFASQPMYGSFFNIEKAYKSIGFDKSFLTPNFDMSEMNNGWLSDESFFNQHFELLKKSIQNEKPILNYLFAVGCHTVIGQNQSFEKIIEYPQSKVLEQFLNCNNKSIKSLVEYVNKIINIDPESLIIIIPDHNPPGIASSTYTEAGHLCDRSQYSFCDRRVNGILIGEGIKLKNKTLAYYEIPEIIVNYISNNELCKTIKCNIHNNLINLNGTIADRKSLEIVSDQSLKIYFRELYISLLKESWIKN